MYMFTFTYIYIHIYLYIYLVDEIEQTGFWRPKCAPDCRFVDAYSACTPRKSMLKTPTIIISQTYPLDTPSLPVPYIALNHLNRWRWEESNQGGI